MKNGLQSLFLLFALISSAHALLAQNCNPPTVVDSLDVVFQQERLIKVDIEDVLVTDDQTCAHQAHFVSASGSSGSQWWVRDFQIGTLIEVTVRITIDGSTTLHQVVLNVQGEESPKFALYIDEIAVEAGEISRIDIWTEGVDSLVGYQLALDIKEAEYHGIDLPSKWEVGTLDHFQNNNLAVGWFDNSVQGQKLEAEETIFSINLTPDADGSSEDLFELNTSKVIAEVVFYINGELIGLDVVLNTQMGSRTPSSVSAVHRKAAHFFPNPAREYLQIIMPAIESVQVYDMNGRSLPAQATLYADRAMLDLAHLTPGTYIVTSVNSAGVAATQKITVQP